ncbi:Uncharacterised protein [Pantoea agglomerans]|uniref:Uncharacterized protein n=1 Tax=Enterobacter agglomerans TaxID=549 RepID=A0A379ACB3_ENTAG|nr:Uncharacterised protein [Pantoea agglomerans]
MRNKITLSNFYSSFCAKFRQIRVAKNCAQTVFRREVAFSIIRPVFPVAPNEASPGALTRDLLMEILRGSPGPVGISW